MRKLIFILLALNGLAANAQRFSVMSFNIRYDNPRDSLNGWAYRKDKVCAQIKDNKIDILGTQEALHSQVLYFENCLPGYTRIGVGRDDGKEKGEYSALFINTNKFTVAESGSFWLSATPDIAGSKGWDAAITRICTWALLKDKMTGKAIYVFNTHFDHIGKIARTESAKLIVRKIDSVSQLQIPVILLGDFNAAPKEEPMQVISSCKYITDTKLLSPKHDGSSGTFNAFGQKAIADEPIDYIFVSKNYFSVKKHITLVEPVNGRYSSDHFPVIAIVGIE